MSFSIFMCFYLKKTKNFGLLKAFNHIYRILQSFHLWAKRNWTKTNFYTDAVEQPTLWSTKLSKEVPKKLPFQLLWLYMKLSVIRQGKHRLYKTIISPPSNLQCDNGVKYPDWGERGWRSKINNSYTTYVPL